MVERIHDGLVIEPHDLYTDYIYTTDGKTIHITRFFEPCGSCGSNHVGCSKMMCPYGIRNPDELMKEII